MFCDFRKLLKSFNINAQQYNIFKNRTKTSLFLTVDVKKQR